LPGEFFAIATLGCKVNRYESEAISEKLMHQGRHIADPGESAGLCVVNTCAVTGKAAMQSRQAVRKMARSHPGALVVVTGCCAQTAPEAFTAMPEVHYVLGNTFKDRIPELFLTTEGRSGHVAFIEDMTDVRVFQDLAITSFGRRTRAFIKIQDGCDAFCTYCIVPFARGRSRSLQPETVVERTAFLRNKGYREVVLSGIHIGRYGQDLSPATSLYSLLRALDTPGGVKRLRLSSIEPMELSEKLVAHIAASVHICPHLHIPLQSGDDTILKAMHRPYTARVYQEMIQHIVQAVPNVSIGVDVMAGFPGETDRAFENTCRIIEALPIAYLHVFPFSARKGTAAQRLSHHVPQKVKKNRCQYLRKLGRSKRRNFYHRFLGSTLEVLIEGKRNKKTNFLKGFTENYIPVFLKGDDRLCHQIVRVRIVGITGDEVFGEIVSFQAR
jgi:threonylcarbamoyladenosine tRNA methylthiotransferase MtaB